MPAKKHTLKSWDKGKNKSEKFYRIFKLDHLKHSTGEGIMMGYKRGIH